jgi:hypothetical protein
VETLEARSAVSQAVAGEGASSTIAGVDYGPFLLDDPFDVIADMSWLDIVPALAGGPIQEDGVVAVLMGDSTPDVLHIAVNGDGCRPEVFVSVFREPPDVELGIAVGDYIVPPGLQCSDILTTHGFEVVLNDPVSLDHLDLGSLPPDDEPDAPRGADRDLHVIVSAKVST